MDFSTVSSFVQAHPIAFVAALLGQLLFVLTIAVLYIKKGRNFKILEVVTLIVAPAISAFAFVFVTFATIANQSVADTRSKAAAPLPPPIHLAAPTPLDAETQHVLFGKFPTTISGVTAVATPSGLPAQAGQTIPIASGSASSYSTLTFSWPPIISSKPEVTIVGYYVYFGTKNPGQSEVNPWAESTFTQTPTFMAQNLQKGNTYYLTIMVRLQSGSTIARKFLERAPGKQIVLFTYIYQ